MNLRLRSRCGFFCEFKFRYSKKGRNDDGRQSELLHVYRMKSRAEGCSHRYSDYRAIHMRFAVSCGSKTLFYNRVRAGFRESARVPRAPAIRAGTREETRHLRANYTFGYFVVLPACGSRNDGLFINDLSLSTRGRLPVVPRKSRA